MVCFREGVCGGGGCAFLDFALARENADFSLLGPLGAMQIMQRLDVKDHVPRQTFEFLFLSQLRHKTSKL
jgi:hypothetical protein